MMTPTLHDVHSVWASFQMNLNSYRSDTEMNVRGQTSTKPVVLLTGFLGAGKSHLLAQLLQNDHGLRIKALVNDVGSLSFDPTFVEAANGHEIALVNGCGCCDQTSDLRHTLEQLASDEKSDLIVLEGSGASDPWALSHIVEASPFVYLDRIVSVIDEREVRTSPGAEDDGRRRRLQRRESAHCVVISHCDQLTENECNEVVALVAAELPGRTITTSSLRLPAWQVLLPASPVGARPNLPLQDSLHENLAVVTAKQSKSITKDDLITAIQNCRPGLLRAKGILDIDAAAFHVQVTPHSVVIDPYNGEITTRSITLVGRKSEDFSAFLAYIN